MPIAAIMVHGRSFEDPFDGNIDLEIIKQVKKQFNDLYDQYGQGNPNSYANLLPGLNKFPFWEKNLGLPQPGFELPRGNSNQVLG